MSTNTPLQEFLKPKLRLFVTADIVGSTQFKQSKSISQTTSQNESIVDHREILYPDWFGTISGFYQQSQIIFHRNWNMIAAKIEAPLGIQPEDYLGQPPSFWKATGDEIGFTKKLKNDICLLVTLRAWLITVNELRTYLKNQNSSLDIKSTAWLAGFPNLNTEVCFSSLTKPNNKELCDDADDALFNALQLLEAFYEQENNVNKSLEPERFLGLSRDYVGPSIDIGFRLSALSTSRKLIISVELAYMLSDSLFDNFNIDKAKDAHDSIDKFTFGYDGRKQLKGVIREEAYPIFWIDTHQLVEKYKRINDAEENLKSTQTITIQNIKELTKSFILAHEEHLFFPFILNNDKPPKPLYGIQPKQHVDRMRNLELTSTWYMKEKDFRKSEVVEQNSTQKPLIDGPKTTNKTITLSYD